MGKRQISLFEDAPAGYETGGLILRSRPDRPLTKTQRAFNKLVAKVERLRATLDRRTKELDQALAYYGEHLHPRQERQTALRKDWVRSLGSFLHKKRFKRKSDFKVLQAVIAEELDEIVQDEGSLTDGDLRKLFERVHGVDIEQAEKAEIEQARSMMEGMFDDFGIDVDLSGLGPDMDEEALAAKAAEIEERIQERVEQEERDFERRQRPRTRRQQEREERIRKAEEVREKSISAVYKQLARVLHPDLEPDPGRRESKVALMQELTAAYRNNDLHTLLRLELEWIQGEEGNLDSLTEEKLAIYNQVLKEQVVGLEEEIESLPFDPRYQPIAVQDSFLGIRLRTDGPAEAHLLDREIARLEERITRMRNGKSLSEIRGVIREYRAANRAAEWSMAQAEAEIWRMFKAQGPHF